MLNGPNQIDHDPGLYLCLTRDGCEGRGNDDPTDPKPALNKLGMIRDTGTCPGAMIDGRRIWTFNDATGDFNENMASGIRQAHEARKEFMDTFAISDAWLMFIIAAFSVLGDRFCRESRGEKMHRHHRAAAVSLDAVNPPKPSNSHGALRDSVNCVLS